MFLYFYDVTNFMNVFECDKMCNFILCKNKSNVYNHSNNVVVFNVLYFLVLIKLHKIFYTPYFQKEQHYFITQIWSHLLKESLMKLHFLCSIKEYTGFYFYWHKMLSVYSRILICAVYTLILPYSSTRMKIYFVSGLVLFDIFLNDKFYLQQTENTQTKIRYTPKERT